MTESNPLVLEIGTCGFGSPFLGLLLTGCVGPGKSLLFSELCPLQLENERAVDLPGKIHSSCHSLVSQGLQAVSQTTLQGVLSYFHISSCSAVGLGVSGSLTLLHCLSMLGARESYRLREARTPCEPRCYTGCFHGTHGTYFVATWWMLCLPCIIWARVKVESSRHWNQTQYRTQQKNKDSEPKDTRTRTHLVFFTVSLWKGFPGGSRGAECCVLVSCAQINKLHPRLKAPGLFLAPFLP